MKKASLTFIAAAAALALSGSVYAQSNNTLATPSTVSPVQATSGYGTPGATSSESGAGAGSQSQGMPTSTSTRTSDLANPPGSHNTLATPSTVSPAAQ